MNPRTDDQGRALKKSQPQIQLALGIDEDKIPELDTGFIEGRPRSDLDDRE